MRESRIEAYFTKKGKGHPDCEVRKLRFLDRNGAPDRLVMAGHEDANLTVFAEIKAPGEKLRPCQVREHRRLRRKGQLVVTISSIVEVDAVYEAVSETLRYMSRGDLPAKDAQRCFYDMLAYFKGDPN